MVPEIAELSAAEWDDSVQVIESYLSTRPVKMQRQVRLFVRILNIAAILATGKTLPRSDIQSRTRFLHRIERGPVPLLRRGLWGVRTLVFMGYYTRPDVHRRIGYRGAMQPTDRARVAMPSAFAARERERTL